MAKLKGLGRGLDALLAGSDETAGAESLHSIPVERIGVGKYQPRTRMDERSLAELAESIKAQGVMQPILVRPVDGGRYRRAGLAIAIADPQLVHLFAENHGLFAAGAKVVLQRVGRDRDAGRGLFL